MSAFESLQFHLHRPRLAPSVCVAVVWHLSFSVLKKNNNNQLVFNRSRRKWLVVNSAKPTNYVESFGARRHATAFGCQSNKPFERNGVWRKTFIDYNQTESVWESKTSRKQQMPLTPLFICSHEQIRLAAIGKEACQSIMAKWIASTERQATR